MNLTPRELANVLLALRMLQAPDGVDRPDRMLILDGHDIMDADEIEDLCEKLNFNDED